MIIIPLLFLAACGSVSSDNKEMLSFSVLYNDVANTPYSSDWSILEEYSRTKNVNMNMILGNDADFEEAIDLNLNSDSPPDVILKAWPQQIEKYANEGKLLAISDYAHLMPNYQAYIEEHNLEAEIDKLRLKNDKYYILPGYQRDVQVQQWIYREDMFEKHNIVRLTTYDELFDALVTLKELYPNTTPITASWGGAHLFSMMGANYGIPAGWSGTRYYQEENDIWKYAPATDNYFAMHQFLNRCYEAGILDPEIFTQSNEAYIEKIVTGKALVTVTWISSGFDTWNNQLEKNGIPNGQWSPMPVMESTVGISALPSINQFRKGLVITASAANKPYFNDMIAFLDWAIYSDEGNDITYWGIEGETYQNTEDGKVFLPHIITPKNPQGTTVMEENGFNIIFNLCENQEFENYKKPDGIVAFLERSELANETLNQTPNLILSSNSIEITSLINKNLESFVSDSSVKFITGEYNLEEDWDAYISSLESMGYQTLESIWNQAWVKQNEE